MLKEKLLATSVFYDNEWLDKYVKLIESNLVQKKIIYKTQEHHIIPRSIIVDNSSDNLVNLLYPVHILAHYYLMMASNNDNTWLDNYLAVKFCLNGYQTDCVNEEWIIKNIPYYLESYERSKVLSIERWRKTFGTRAHINNGKVDKRVKIEELDQYIESGWVLGRIPNKKYGHSQSGKNNGNYGIYKYTNGVDILRCRAEDAPEGYYRTNPELEHIKKIECIETGIIYKSIREAGNLTGISTDHIRKMCKNIQFKSYKELTLHFRYACI